MQVDELLDLHVGDAQRLDDLLFLDLFGACFDHDDGVFGAADHQIEGGVFDLFHLGIDDILAVDDGHTNRAERPQEGDPGNGQRGRRPDHRQDVVGVLVVDGKDGAHDLRLVHVALGEQRPDGPVDLPGGEDGLVRGTRLALDEAAGDLAGCVHALLDVHGQREEVLRFAAFLPADGSHQDHSVSAAHYDGAARLLGETASLEGDCLAPDLGLNNDHSLLFFLFQMQPPPGAVGPSCA